MPVVRTKDLTITDLTTTQGHPRTISPAYSSLEIADISEYDSSGNVIPCEGTGQDGDIQAGVAWPDPRFVEVGECVTDNLTGVMW